MVHRNTCLDGFHLSFVQHVALSCSLPKVGMYIKLLSLNMFKKVYLISCWCFSLSKKDAPKSLRKFIFADFLSTALSDHIVVEQLSSAVQGNMIFRNCTANLYHIRK